MRIFVRPGTAGRRSLWVGCSSGSSSSLAGHRGRRRLRRDRGAGNPNGSCSAGVPAKGQPADTSSPTTVVGTGTAASCTFSALQAAVDRGRRHHVQLRRRRR